MAWVNDFGADILRFWVASQDFRGDITLSEARTCCGRAYPALTPSLFSFNSPLGMCPDCNGIGSRVSMDPAKIVPDRSLSIREGAGVPWAGYFKRGGKYMPSIIAELGHIVEKHLISIGLMKAPVLDEGQKEMLAQKRAEFEEAMKQQDAFADNDYPEGAQLCSKCNTAAVIMMDGCMTCLSCGDSKCG